MASDGKLYGATAFPSGTGNGTIYKGTTGGGVTDLYKMVDSAKQHDQFQREMDGVPEFRELNGEA
jgi:hypothetical protein